MEAPRINITPFLDEDGRILQLPKKQSKRRAVLTYLCHRFEPGRVYTEKEVNELCRQWHTFDDYFLVRRELVDARLLLRKDDGSAYWRSPACSDESE